MKNRFDFTLTGKKLLPAWLVYLILVIYPSFYFKIDLIEDLKNQFEVRVMDQSYMWDRLMDLGISIAALLIAFFLVKITVEHIKYADNPLRFEGKFATYLGKSMVGLFLSIITLGIYSAWFIKNITKFFVNKSSLKESGFDFQGSGGLLFVYMLFTVIFPAVLISRIFALCTIGVDITFLHLFILLAVVMIVMVPYMYLICDWFMDINYKGYHIKWQTKFGRACLTIWGQLLLSMVTLGIYAPLAFLKLYRYFAGKTVAESPEKTLRLGYELDAKGDFLFLWGQLLLTLVTAGIYFPWAFSKIGKRMLAKTYIGSIEL